MSKFKNKTNHKQPRHRKLCCSTTTTATSILRPFFQDNQGKPGPER